MNDKKITENEKKRYPRRLDLKHNEISSNVFSVTSKPDFKLCLKWGWNQEHSAENRLLFW
ncbi:MAG: hypothetical protein OES64_11615 [Desulfobacteraceae bacterium]|nr:hypothetical protein [Desulfobacteraceae bacterium]MDH3722084.1 hypothetical protein [Desulfobacteraceae bacterium]MDH3837704.1 hypothetical protein [Desulfobacteraceae bacterium]MDH3882193.1 hypothetical protein [Desulfobacteraceae bacterium]PLX51125.1 MAG: hypothetical protein C0611_09465 [Desulfobacteraceae bacterium]